MIVKKAQTLSIVAGTRACNARCPDCVSEMTTRQEDNWMYYYKGIDKANFDIALNTAISAGVGTALFTGKGELTIYPQQMLDYLEFLNQRDYRQISRKELQSNGLLFQRDSFAKDGGWLDQWYDQKLRLISLSVVHWDDEVNKAFYTPHLKKPYPPLEKTVEILHSKGYTVRLSVTMVKDRVDSPQHIDSLVTFCKKNGIRQLSVRPVRKNGATCNESQNAAVWNWVKHNELTQDQEKDIAQYMDQHGYALQKLVHGATVYQIRGQNVCLTDCLTMESGQEEFRQIIFYSCGMIALDWSNPGAVIYEPGRDCMKMKDKLVAKARAQYKPFNPSINQ
jgi:pyruvate-formate lyase-activating enzyme